MKILPTYSHWPCKLRFGCIFWLLSFKSPVSSCVGWSQSWRLCWMKWSHDWTWPQLQPNVSQSRDRCRCVGWTLNFHLSLATCQSRHLFRSSFCRPDIFSQKESAASEKSLTMILANTMEKKKKNRCQSGNVEFDMKTSSTVSGPHLACESSSLNPAALVCLAVFKLLLGEPHSLNNPLYLPQVLAQNSHLKQPWTG